MDSSGLRRQYVMMGTIVRHGSVALDLNVPGRHPAVIETLGPGQLVGWSWLFAPGVWQSGPPVAGAEGAPARSTGDNRRPEGDVSQERVFTPESPIRVFLLDDHEVVRRGVHDLLDLEPDITVVGEASTSAQALVCGPALRPDAAILDIRLPDSDGITVCRELRDRMPELACLMLTSFDDDDALLDAIMAGAAGYVLRQIKGSDLVTAVRTVASGQSMLDPATTGRLMRSLRAPSGQPGSEAGQLDALTVREREILDLIGEGLTNRQIGKRIYLSEKTVKNHISRLLAKLGVERRVQAAVLAVRLAPLSHDT
jgi:two-component system response regulator DevR